MHHLKYCTNAQNSTTVVAISELSIVQRDRQHKNLLDFQSHSCAKLGAYNSLDKCDNHGYLAAERTGSRGSIALPPF